MTDLRLVVPAAVAWATALACTAVTGVSALVPIGLVILAVTLLSVVLFDGRGIGDDGLPSLRRASLRGMLATLAFSAAVACAVTIAVVSAGGDRRPAVLEDAVATGGIVDLDVTIESEARPLGGFGDLAVTDVTVTAVTTRATTNSELSAPAVLFVAVDNDGDGVAPGRHVTVSARVEDGRPGDRAAFVLRAAGESTAKRVDPPADPAGDLRRGFTDLAHELQGDGAALLPGLAVGDTSLVDDALDERMKAASLSHLTAVSGANCALVVGAVFGLLALFGAPRSSRVVAALVALGGFVALVTPEPSVVRAAVMAAIVLIAIALGRPSAGVPVLGLAVIAILLSDPWLSRSFGFALSAAATAGLLLLAGPLTRVLERVLPSPVAAALALPLAAQLACQPIIVMLDPSVPVWGVAANMLAAPAAPVATVLGMVACLLVPVAPLLAHGAALLAWLPAQWIAGVAAAASAAPGGDLPWLAGLPGVIAWTVVLALVATIATARTTRTGRIALAILVGGSPAYGAVAGGARLGELLSRPTDWVLAMCDVGQGDAVVIRSAGRTALIDTGPEPDAVDGCLSDLGVGQVDLLVLTHFDLDHVGGVPALVGRTSQVLHQPMTDPADGDVLRPLAVAGARLVETTSGVGGTLGALPWRALWPPPDTPRYSGNDGSLVLEFGGALDAIFLGDLGKDSELALLADGVVAADYAIVKFAHHGSADQYPALYERISARLALVSCGIDNDYGHPTPSALALLQRLGTSVARTDRDGTTLVAVRGGAIVTWAAGPRSAPG